MLVLNARQGIDVCLGLGMRETFSGLLLLTNLCVYIGDEVIRVTDAYRDAFERYVQTV